jgi:hypothetical protein
MNVYVCLLIGCIVYVSLFKSLNAIVLTGLWDKLLLIVLKGFY